MLKYELSAKAKELYAQLETSVAARDALRIKDAPKSEQDTAKKDTGTKCNALNKCILQDILGQYVDLAATDATAVMRDWLADPFYIGYKVSQHSAKKGGDYFIDTTAILLPFSVIDSASKTVRLNSNGAWKRYIVIFAHNCIMFSNSAENGEKKQFGVEVDELPAEYKPLRDKLPGWDKFDSKNALHKQFNELVRMIMPEGIKCLMLKSDIAQFTKAVTSLAKANSVKNFGVNFNSADEDALETILFRFIFTRVNNLSIKYSGKFEAEGDDTAAETEGEEQTEDAPKTAEKEAPKA